MFSLIIISHWFAINNERINNQIIRSQTRYILMTSFDKNELAKEFFAVQRVHLVPNITVMQHTHTRTQTFKHSNTHTHTQTKQDRFVQIHRRRTPHTKKPWDVMKGAKGVSRYLWIFLMLHGSNREKKKKSRRRTRWKVNTTDTSLRPPPQKKGDSFSKRIILNRDSKKIFGHVFFSSWTVLMEIKSMIPIKFRSFMAKPYSFPAKTAAGCALRIRVRV